MKEKKITYRNSGVDIARSNRTKARIKRLVTSTYTANVLADFGSFGGLCKLPREAGKSPVLVASVDGVGTKLKLAFTMKKHDTVGIDIISHCCNDILVQGAVPLFFMDYIAMGKHRTGVVADIIKGLARGCRLNQCVLLGGEMAEMPDFYQPGEYDLAGMVVGWVDRRRLIDGSRIRPGNVILGLASDGLHTNGYSLARKVLFGIKQYQPSTYMPQLGHRLGEVLLKPHRSYVKPILATLKKYTFRGLAHITGGGMPDNILRVLPSQCTARIKLGTWPVPAIFDLIQASGNITRNEMWRVFNMGIGMVAVVQVNQAKAIATALRRCGERVYVIGEIVKGKKAVQIV